MALRIPTAPDGASARIPTTVASQPRIPSTPYPSDWHVPAFADAAYVDSTGATVADGGAPGRVTFSAMSSGMSAPANGGAVVWPLRDILGGIVPDVAPALGSASNVRTRMPFGALQLDVLTAPTLGNGVLAGIVAVAAPSAATALNITHAQGMGAAWDGGATPGVRQILLRSAGYSEGTLDTHADVYRVRALGEFGRFAVATGHSLDADVMRSSSSNLAENLITSANQGDKWWLVVWAYRDGATAGTESVTVEVKTKVLDTGVTE